MTTSTHVDNSVENVDNSQERKDFPAGKPTLCIFAKQPIPGRVKTRLCPPLKPQQACALYFESLRESVSRLRLPNLRQVLCYSGERHWFAQTFPGVPLIAQGEGSLGDRLQQASEALFLDGAGPLLIAGSDSPDLPLSLIREALMALQRADVVTIPAQDGGYVLIGSHRYSSGLFVKIPWSTPDVLEATRLRALELGLIYSETAGWDDLDDLAALHRLIRRSPKTRTASYLRHELNLGNLEM